MSNSNLRSQWPYLLLLFVLVVMGVLLAGSIVYNYPVLGLDRTISIGGLAVAYVLGATSVALSLRLERMIRRPSTDSVGATPAPEWRVELSRPIPGASVGIFLVVVVAVVLTFVILPLPAGNNSLSLVVATSGLIFATLIYAYFTFGLVRVTDLARREQVQPVIKSALWFLGPVAAVLRCQNIGRGSATELEATIEVFPQTLAANVKWVEPVLLPLAFRDFFLPALQFEALAATVDYVIVKGMCRDAFGRVTEIHSRVDVKDLLANIKASRMRLVDSVEDLLKDIAKHSAKLSDIEEQLKLINETMKNGRLPQGASEKPAGVA